MVVSKSAMVDIISVVFLKKYGFTGENMCFLVSF